MKEMEVRRIVKEKQSTAQVARASLTQRQAPKLNVSMLFDGGYDSGVDAYMDDMEEEEQRKKELERQKQEDLVNLVPIDTLIFCFSGYMFNLFISFT